MCSVLVGGKTFNSHRYCAPSAFDSGLKITHFKRGGVVISVALFKLQETMPEAKENLLAKPLLILATCMRSLTYCTLARRPSVCDPKMNRVSAKCRRVGVILHRGGCALTVYGDNKLG